MAKRLGDKVEPHDLTPRLPDTDGDTSVGDAVAVDAGDATPFDGDVHNAVVAVRPSGDMAGDNIPATMSGVVIASVASGVTAGDGVGGGNATNGTVGELESGGDRGVALSDAGGTYAGADLPDGAAAVYLH